MSNYWNEFYARQQIKATVLGTPVESLQIKAAAGQVGILNISNVNAAARWAYVFDSASADAGNIIAVFALAIGGSVAWMPMFPVSFLLGCKVHSSDTAVFHASASADLNIAARFI